MENVSKALVMAASVLLGIIILSLMVFLFNKMTSFGRNTFFDPEKSRQINEFNSKIRLVEDSLAKGEKKYSSRKDRATLGDLLTIINFVNDYNLEQKKAHAKDYIKVIVNGKDTSKWFDDFGNRNNKYLEFVKENTINLKFQPEKQFIKILQKDNIQYDSIGRIKQIEFEVEREDIKDESE